MTSSDSQFAHRLHAAAAHNRWLRPLAALLIVFLLDPQPVWLPLVHDLRAARVAARSGETALAADRLVAAFARQPWNAELALEAGLAGLAAGQYEAALRYLQIAWNLNSNDAGVRAAMGDARAGMGDSAAAVEDWQAAQAMRGDEPGLLARLGHGYQQLGRLEDSLATYSLLAAQHPEDVQAQYRIALLSAALQPSQSLTALARVAQVSPELAPTVNQLSASIQDALASGGEAQAYAVVGYTMIPLAEWPLAQAALQRAIDLDPDRADLYAYLGLAVDEQAGDGLEWYRRAVEVDPASALAHAMLGMHWRRAGKDDLARAELERAYELDPDNAGIAAELGGLFEAAREMEAAEAWYRRAVERSPKDAQFWLLLARFYVENEVKVDPFGLEAATRAAALAPDSARAIDLLGFGLYLVGRLDEAERALIRALELDPKLPSALYHLGVLQVTRDRPAEAARLFREAIAQDPQGLYGGLAYKALTRLGP